MADGRKRIIGIARDQISPEPAQT